MPPRYPSSLAPDATLPGVVRAQKSRSRREPSGAFQLFQAPQIQQFKEAFSLIDQDGDGIVSEKDLKAVFTNLGLTPTAKMLDSLLSARPGNHFRGPSAPDEDDSIPDRGVNFPMFLTMMGERLFEFDSEAEVVEAFECFDENDTGTVKVEEVRKWLSEIGDRMSGDEIDRLLKGPYTDRQGNFKYREWVKVVRVNEEPEEGDVTNWRAPSMPTSLSLAGSSSDAITRRTLSHLSLGVAKSKKIIVVTGAGISCSCGIPDFRSSDGLYSLVKQQYPDVVLKGRDLFDASLFRDPTSTSVFYTFISKLKQSVDAVSPSPTHEFIKTLDVKGKLLRSYTQNIDGLEEQVGLLGSASEDAKENGKGKAKIRLRDVKNVQLHGDIRRVRCVFCSAEFIFTEEHTKSFLEGIAPDCPDCLLRSEARVARSARALKIGKLRPGIVLYDEPHPLGDEIGSIESTDLSRKPDLLIIMGTSLKVHGLKKLVKDFAKAVHANAPTTSPCSLNSPKAMSSKNVMKGKVIFVNKTPPTSEWDGIIDYHIDGETDAWVERVLGDWKKMRPSDWEQQTTLNDANDIFKASKENAATKKAKATKGSRRGRRINNGSENIPPISPPSKPQEPQPGVKRSIMNEPPSSPSKRRQGVSYHSDLECSPYKKTHTLVTIDRQVVPAEERGMLFGTSRTANQNVGVEIDSGAMKRSNRKLKRQQSESSLAGLENGLEVTSLVDPVLA